jgi:hypothetical protein
MTQERIKARHYDRNGRVIAIDYFNDSGPSRHSAELFLFDASSLLDTIALAWPDGDASRASADLKAAMRAVRAGALDPDDAERLAKRTILQAARGFTGAGIYAAAYNRAKREDHPNYVTDAEVFEQASKFRDLQRRGMDRDGAYRVATGSSPKRVTKRFKDMCVALRCPWQEKPRGPRRGTKQTKPRQSRAFDPGPQYS